MSLLDYYRGYMFSSVTNGNTAAKVRYKFRFINYHAPRKFLWNGSCGEELREYIDAVLFRRMLVRRKYEHGGIATDLEYDDPPKDVPTMIIDPHVLTSILLGEYPVEMPINTMVVVKPGDGSRFSVTKFIAELASSGVIDAYEHGLAQRIANGLNLRATGAVDGSHTTTDSYITAVKDATAGPHYNLKKAEAAGEKLEPGLMEKAKKLVPEPPQEHVVTSKVFSDCTEVISIIVHGDNPAYYLRRVFDNDGTLTYSATSWSLEGPWANEYQGKTA